MFYKKNALFAQQGDQLDQTNIANGANEKNAIIAEKEGEGENGEQKNVISQVISEQNIENSISDIGANNVFSDSDEVVDLQDKDSVTDIDDVGDDSSPASEQGLSEGIVENSPDIENAQQVENLEISPEELRKDLENLKKLEEILNRENDSVKDSLISGLKGIINGMSSENSALDERKVLEVVDRKIDDIESQLSFIENDKDRNVSVAREDNFFKTDSVGVLEDADLNKSASLDLSEQASETTSKITDKNDDISNAERFSKRAEMNQFNYDFIKKSEKIAKERMENFMQDFNDLANSELDFSFDEDISEIHDIEKYTERVFDIEKNDSYLINEINDLEEIISDARSSKIKMDSGEELNDGDKMNIAIIDEISRHGLKAGNKLLTEFINDGSKIDAAFEKSAKNIQDIPEKFDKEMDKLNNAVDRKLAQEMLKKSGISLNDLKEVSGVKDMESKGLSENIKPEQSIGSKAQSEERGR